jgi:hypothetical protein
VWHLQLLHHKVPVLSQAMVMQAAPLSTNTAAIYTGNLTVVGLLLLLLLLLLQVASRK